jgi:solute carrier family 13 (sodium-dependent dicarboxylate transporter), member 2/3/5
MTSSEDRAAGGVSALDVWRSRAGLALAPSAAAVIMLAGEGGPKTTLAALFAATAILWITEALPPAVTALLAVSFSIVLGIATPREAFAALGNPILFLFVGSFMIAEAMNMHGLGARFARAMTRGVKGRLGAMIATSSAAFLLSMWTSNSASAAVVLPIALHIAKGAGSGTAADRRYGSAMVLAIAWAASMGGLCTPVGTPPNLIGLRALADHGMPLDFFGWMKIGAPVGIVMLAAMWLVLALVFRVRPGQPATAAGGEARPWTRGEAAAFASFSLAVFLWMLPGVLDAVGSPWGKAVKARLPEEVVALLAASILFMWPIHARGEAPRTALRWKDASRIDWGTVLLFGGGILLGDLGNKTGLAGDWGRAMIEATGASSPWALVALVTAAAILLSELASNTASATLMVPIAFALAQSAGTPPVPAVLGATIGASFGFMMPISTAPNAMAYATGQVSIRQMIAAGIFFDVAGFIVVVAALRVLCPLFGLDQLFTSG